jgi:hypothetical protein
MLFNDAASIEMIGRLMNVTMRIGKGNWNTRRKSAAMPHCPQILYNLTGDRTRAATLKSQRLPVWAVAHPVTSDWYQVTTEGILCNHPLDLCQFDCFSFPRFHFYFLKWSGCGGGSRGEVSWMVVAGWMRVLWFRRDRSRTKSIPGIQLATVPPFQLMGH